MKTLTLPRALVYKKRLIEKINSLTKDIETYNCVVVSDDPLQKPNREINVPGTFIQRKRLVEHLIDLKCKIAEKNLMINSKIYLLAEIKGEISFLRKLKTTQGPASDRWNETIVNYDSAIRRADVEKRVSELTSLLDKTQEEIDTYNHSTKIEVEDVNF